MSKQQNQSGFTVLELLIATLIFSLVLIIITTGVMQFTRQYYKGIISSNTQTVARTLIDDVTRAIQFNPGGVAQLTTNTSGGVGEGWCIGGNKRYSFATNAQVLDSGADPSKNQYAHGLIADDYTGCNTGSPALNVKATGALTTPNARELLGARMRVVKFTIEPISDVYVVTVRIAYGDDDLLCSPTLPAAGQGGCSHPGDPGVQIDSLKDLKCKLQTGSQFCAVSELVTTVKKRVN